MQRFLIQLVAWFLLLATLGGSVVSNLNFDVWEHRADPPPSLEQVLPPALTIEAGAHFFTFESEATDNYLDYYLHIPEGATEQMPLIIFLHGDGEVNEVHTLKNFAMMKSARAIYGEEFPFIGLTPCTRQYSWISGTIPETLMDLILYTCAQYNVDAQHIILTGHSRGAIGVWHIVGQYGDFFSAAVPVSCDSESPFNIKGCVNVPIWGFIGGGDYHLYGRLMQQHAADINALGGSARITVLDSCTHGATKDYAYTQEVFEWMLAQ